MMYKRILRIILIVFSTTILCQLCTMFVLSDSNRSKACIDDLSLLVHIDQFDSIAYLNNLGEPKLKLKKIITDRYQDTVNYITVLDRDKWSRKRIDPNFLAIRMEFSSPNFMTFDVKVDAGSLHYGESWYSRYIWILNRWYRVSHELRGVS